MHIEVLVPRARGASESIHIAFQEGELPGGGTIVSIADEIARQLVEKLASPPDAPGEVPRLSAQRLQRVLAHVDEHLGERVTVGHLAAVAHISAFHFARMFKRTTGMPPHAYMTRRRIERAKELLASGARSVTDVCMEVGFSSVGSFSALFARRVGVAPRDWQRRVRTVLPSAELWPAIWIPGCFLARHAPSTFGEAMFGPRG